MSSAVYIIPWSSMLPIAGITAAVMCMRPIADYLKREDGREKKKALDYFDYLMKERDIKNYNNQGNLGFREPYEKL
ncbi:hypothetical protein MP638_003989 [Amoeboaphelidium occidentale]|nr:hypothetical protein MP638_003989 [Amoeboaphelidium occidentale]